jgi:predicted alpha/beta-hydrolase family hydrolase
MIKPQPLTFLASKSSGKVSALFLRPADAAFMLVFGHGAGAGMRHPFMEAMSRRLGDRKIATFRYQFPYMEKRAGRPDPQPILLATVSAAVEAALRADDSLPLFAGGKSMGGRMTSLAAAAEPLPRVRGIVFFGFPLHPPGTPGTDRAKHLSDVTIPMLFLQGTRDKFADLNLLRPICSKLKATLHIIDGGDHSFNVRKSADKTMDDVYDEMAEVVARWAKG